MADVTGKNNIEKIEQPLAPGERKEADLREKKEILDKSKEFVEGVSEVVEGAEVAEFAEGEVSEKVKEGKRKVPAGTGIAAKGDAAAKVQKYVMPRLDIMRIQIGTKIKKEIIELEKEYKKIVRSPANFSPFRLTEIISKIRELKDVLSELANASVEQIKTLWQRFVKGVKS